MSQAEFTGMLIVGIGALIGIITPIVKLNVNIAKLNATLDHLGDDYRRTETRLNSHSEKIDDHDTRITKLESK